MTLNSVSLFLLAEGVSLPVVIVIAVLAVVLGIAGGIFVGMIWGKIWIGKNQSMFSTQPIINRFGKR